MRELFLGWDVGAWNCDRNAKSRDALCALTVAQDGIPELLGRAWRGNLRDALVSSAGSALVQALVQRTGADPLAFDQVTIAIDTPLAWPMRMIDLVTRGATAHVPEKADHNPYLFREQELALFAIGRPLSVVRDMIGSQSTKGIHFLLSARLEPKELGIWLDADRSTRALETYPALALRDVALDEHAKRLGIEADHREGVEHTTAWKSDVRDAIACALVAWLYRTAPEQLVSPDSEADEGWIWLPRSIGEQGEQSAAPVATTP